MIASKRGLAVLGGVVVVLVLVLVMCTGNDDDAPKDRALVPGFDEKRVTELAWSQGSSKWGIKRVDGTWRFDTGPQLVDAATVDAIFTALRGGTWHRKKKAASDTARRRSPSDPRVALRFGNETLVIDEQVQGTDQTWVIRGEHAYLVDGWVAKALAPGQLALRVRGPIADCTSAESIEAKLEGATIRLVGAHLVAPRNAWIDETWIRALADACAGIEIVSVDTKFEPAPGLRMVLEGKGTFAEVGTCGPNRVFVETPSGPGCVDGTRMQALRDALRALLQKPHETIDLRPLPIAPVKLTLPDGAVLDLAGKPRLDDGEADAGAVRVLIRALTARGKRVVDFPRTRPRGNYFAVAKDTHQISLTLFDRVVARSGELGAIEVDDATWEILTRPTAALRDPTRWREDAANITEIKLDNVKYKRGAVLGEWTREPAGTVDNALVGAVVETLGTVRAPASATKPSRVEHRLRVTITPPTGKPIRHELELGAATGQGCPGRIDRELVTLPLALCTAAFALAAAK